MTARVLLAEQTGGHPAPGKDRGVRAREVFQIYKAEERGAARGRLAGQVIVKDVRDNACWGEYLPHLREAPAPGDFAVAVPTVHAGLVDPEESRPERFPAHVQQPALATR